MNLRIFADLVERARALTAVEQVGIDTMRRIMPERPTVSVYDQIEETGYEEAYDLMVPDADHEDAESYDDWLRARKTDDEFRRACVARYIELEKLCISASMDPMTLARKDYR